MSTLLKNMDINNKKISTSKEHILAVPQWKFLAGGMKRRANEEMLESAEAVLTSHN